MPDVVHTNNAAGRSRPRKLGCGALRGGALVTGDPERVTCKDCLGEASPDEEEAEDK